MQLSVIMPAYNEGKHICSNIQVLLEVLSTTGLSYEIIVVSDGSNDNTVDEAMKMVLNRRVKVYHYACNQGKGYAVKYGFERSSGQYVVFIDADLDLHPKSINDFIDLLLLNNLQIVIGSKRHPKSEVFYPRSRRFMSASYYLLIKLMFGLQITDSQSGIKLFKREVLEKVMPFMEVRRYAFDLELLALAKRFGFTKIQEAPIVLNYRFSGTGINVKAVYQMMKDTIGIFYRLHVTKYYEKKAFKDIGFQW